LLKRFKISENGLKTICPCMDKWDSSSALREVLLFDVKSARSSPLASDIAGLKGKLESPFVLK
jgi:hypothetical protein